MKKIIAIIVCSFTSFFPLAAGSFIAGRYSYLGAPSSGQNIAFQQLVKISNEWARQGAVVHGMNSRFPLTANRMATIAGSDAAKQARIVEQACNVHPILDQNVMELIKSFLAIKLVYGTPAEKAVYQGMAPEAFVDRLLKARPLMFMNKNDDYLLRNGVRGSGGFETIQSDYAKLRDYLSYDEMLIAALLGVAVPTYFINDGNRNNSGRPGTSGTFEEQGIYVGLVGARFEKPGFMEWQHMIITREQNTVVNGYGPGVAHSHPHPQRKSLLAMWETFYGEKFRTFDEVKSDKSGRYLELGNDKYFDRLVYKKRLKAVLKPYLYHANRCGQEAGKKVYCYCIGLGLGIWKINDQQAAIMLDAYSELLNEGNFPHIADVDFAWFPAQYQSCGGVGNLGKIKNITIHFSQRNPTAKLTGLDQEKLLMPQYAWDGNAFPGNEYWIGALTASGDPAAASCSTIGELQNPYINDCVSARNLRTY